MYVFPLLVQTSSTLINGVMASESYNRVSSPSSPMVDAMRERMMEATMLWHASHTLLHSRSPDEGRCASLPQT